MADHIVELITADHRRFEDLMRTVRDRTADRAGALAELAALLVAHAEAEEHEAYPALEANDAADDEEVEHGEREHSAINAALLLVLETDDVDSEEFEDRLHELSELLAHHLDEEERDLLNGARQELTAEQAADIGRRFADVRRRLLDADCGAIGHVRSIQTEAGLAKLQLGHLAVLAAAQDVAGRSTMTKDELVGALASH